MKQYLNKEEIIRLKNLSFSLEYDIGCNRMILDKSSQEEEKYIIYKENDKYFYHYESRDDLRKFDSFEELLKTVISQLF